MGGFKTLALLEQPVLIKKSRKAHLLESKIVDFLLIVEPVFSVQWISTPIVTSDPNYT
jgi:hypothetical protein